MAGYNSYAAQRRVGSYGSPPDRGSFPLDHWNDCTGLKDDYLACLKRNMNDNLSCRFLTKEYLQCRMDHNLMAQEEYCSTLVTVGLVDREEYERPPRLEAQETEAQKRQREGYIPGWNQLVLEDRNRWKIMRIFALPDFELLKQWGQALFLLKREDVGGEDSGAGGGGVGPRRMMPGMPGAGNVTAISKGGAR
eukprot:g11917.t1